MKKMFRNYAALLITVPFLLACPGGSGDDADDAMNDESMEMGEMEMEMDEMEMEMEMEMGEMEMASMIDEPCWIREGAELEGRASPLMSTSFEFDGGMGTICYGAPSARGRMAFGEVVAYGEPWRLGANEATAIHLTGPASIGGVALDAGSYSVYATPMSDGDWEITFNSMHERWGIPINEEVMAGDVGSFMATPEETEEMVETMTFTFEPWENERAMGDLVMSWEDTRVKMHVHPAG
ncbi:MAG: DUF2911 domain-containing protein [Gemmatimonadetes bacterium]|nr:DUF2911 domain-containing protein [Gemmatimonadota bacterium]